MPIDFVFHGGSGSSVDEIREAISYGNKNEYRHRSSMGFYNWNKKLLQQQARLSKSQIGNPQGEDIPNKKYYDPRVWLREGEITFKERLTKCFTDLNNVNRNK